MRPEAVGDAYRVARIEAEEQTGIDEGRFPADSPWLFEQLMDGTFWPD